MGISRSSLVESETFKFLLAKRIPGREEVFEDVPEGELQPGDIVLFPRNNSSSVFKHAAVYWQDGEIIYLKNSKEKGVQILKKGFNAVKLKGEKFQIYRKKGGINLEDFSRNVHKAMNCEANYRFYRNNCIHFALSLLGLLNFYVDLVRPPDEDSNKSVVKSQTEGNGKKRKKCIVM